MLDPPIISNPMLILIVGSFGLASNLVGFAVLGGHGHSHGPGEEGHDHDHAHGHDVVKDAEEGRNGYGATEAHADEAGRAADVFPESIVTKYKNPRQLDFSTEDSESTKVNSGQRKHHGRRRSSIRRNSHFRNIDELSIHPSSFRQEIIAASKMDGIDSGDVSSDEAHGGDGAQAVTENSPLLAKKNSHTHEHGKNREHSNGHTHNDHHGHDHNHDHDHDHEHTPKKKSIVGHENHNHKKPKKAAAGHGGHNHADMGMRAMILHVAGDALGNVGVIVAALIIWLTDSPYRYYSDPAVSLFITLIILHSTIPLTVATAKILLQATPDHLDVQEIKQDIQSIPGVVSCHHVHIWQLSDSQVIASLHIQISFPLEDGSERYMQLAKLARECLHEYGIHSATIQPEFCLDENHDHTAAQLGMDGDRVGDTDTDSCLLECVDDCNSKGCCAPSVEPQHDHSSHDGHAH